MSNRIDNNNSSAQRVASTSSQPADSSAISQAAADFASLLGSDSSSSSSSPSEPNSDYSSPTNDNHSSDDPQVERREERQDSDQESDSSGHKEKGKDSKEKTETPSPGDQILKSFGRFEATAAKVDSPMQPDSTKSLEGIIQAVADKMLVSDVSGNREVRIMLKDSVLPGTEVRISQQAGKMQIQFVTDSAKSQELLSQHQAILQQRLNDKLSSHDVVVSVEMESEGYGDQPQGESRGKQDQQQDDQD